MPNATAPQSTSEKSMSAARALPKATTRDEYQRLQLAKIVADARFEVAAEDMKAAAAAAKDDQDPELRASAAFSSAYHAWLIAKAGLEESLIEEEEQPARFKAEAEAERALFSTPAAYPDQLWKKLGAFEAILSDELQEGKRRYSIVMLALGSIKQDVLNLELCEGRP